jgi:hypothetical protein
MLPHDRSWQQVMMVPFMDLNLILTEERISLIICDIPVASARLVARGALATVERILVNCGDDSALCWEDEALCSLLTARGYSAGPHDTGQSGVLFSRPRTSN